MIRNELRNTAIENSEATSLTDNVSEYMIGHTKFVVSVHFNNDTGETFEDMINRLIMKDIVNLSA